MSYELKGCLPRLSEFATYCPALADQVVLYTDEEIAELLDAGQGSVMIPFIPITLDQKSDKSCASAATTGGTHLAYSLTGNPCDELNHLSLYHYVKGSQRARDGGGSNIDANLRHARDVGILREAIYPQSAGHMKAPPKELMETEAPKHRIHEFLDVNEQADWRRELVTALLSPFPTIFGLRGHAVDGVGVLRDPADPTTLRKLRIVYHNSWDGSPAPWNPWMCPEYPDITGLGWVPIDWIEAKYGLFAIRTTVDGRGEP